MTDYDSNFKIIVFGEKSRQKTSLIHRYNYVESNKILIINLNWDESWLKLFY